MESAYWFLKGEMQSRAPLNKMDLEQILEMLQNVPAKEMNEAMEQAEMMGDEAAMIVLVMADNKRKFREKYASEYVLLGTMQSTPADGYNGYMKMMRDARKLVEIGNETGLDQKLGEAYQDESGRWFLPILERKASEDYDPDYETTEETVARTTAYFAALKDKNPDLARKIEFSVKNYDGLPRKEIEDAGFDYQVIDEWVDYVGVEDDNLVEYEQCSDCEGEGIIITKYYPATRYDPADADFEKCEMCFGSGRIDPADYMDYDGNYMAESLADLVERKYKLKTTITKGDLLKKKKERLKKKNAESFEAETKKRKTGFRKCSKCGYSDHNSSNCNRLDEYETYRKHKDEMLKECDDAIQRFTRSAKRYSEDGEYGLAKMLRSDATDMKKLKRMIENNHFGKAVHFAMRMDSDPRDLAPSALWMFYDAESFESDSWLTEGKCAICNSPSKFTVMTAIGERSFCCEACYADYMGLPIEEEGYYGLASEYIEHSRINEWKKSAITYPVLKYRNTPEYRGFALDIGLKKPVLLHYSFLEKHGVGIDDVKTVEVFDHDTEDPHRFTRVIGFNAEEKESMNPYLLGAGIFALTLGLLSRKR